MNLHDQVAVVTGGANGIGLATAKHLRTLGATVVVADSNAEALRGISKEPSFRGVQCDVRSDTDIANLADRCNEVGEVGLVMANAGIAVGGRFEEIPVDEWQRLLDINVTGVVRTIKAFLPAMLERGRGHIVITGSSAGLFRSDGFDTPYSASKYALRGMAQGLAVYCRPSGVGVHYLAPRITDTAFPRSSVAWGRSGSRVTSDRSLGDDYDTVDDVVAALFAGIEHGDFLISLTADTRQRLEAYAIDPLADR